MGRYLLRRITHGLIVIGLVTVVVFIVTRVVSDPVRVMLPLDATEEEQDALAQQIGFDRPIPEQFVDFVGDIARFDLGDSLWQRRPALDIVLERLPNTLELTAAGMGLVLLISLPLGIGAALRPNSRLDRLTMTGSTIGLSIPQFWLGALLIMLFGVRLGWLPTSGIGGVTHVVLPALTLALPTSGRLSSLVRSTMIDELDRPWVKAARARGLPSRRTVTVHALRNAAVPIVTLAGWELIRMLAGTTVLVEVVFAWPGIGSLALESAERNDLILLQAVVLVAATMIVFLNILVDLSYRCLDPRIQLA